MDYEEVRMSSRKANFGGRARSAARPLALVLTGALLVQACGGGSGGSSSKAPTPLTAAEKRFISQVKKDQPSIARGDAKVMAGVLTYKVNNTSSHGLPPDVTKGVEGVLKARANVLTYWMHKRCPSERLKPVCDAWGLVIGDFSTWHVRLVTFVNNPYTKARVNAVFKAATMATDDWKKCKRAISRVQREAKTR